MNLCCTDCGKEITIYHEFSKIDGQPYCSQCANTFFKDALNRILVTTEHTIDGYRVKKVLHTGSVEIVMSLRVIFDFLESSPIDFERRIKAVAVDKLKLEAFHRKANAVIDADLNCREFSKDKIDLVANGTFVITEPLIRGVG